MAKSKRKKVTKRRKTVRKSKNGLLVGFKKKLKSLSLVKLGLIILFWKIFFICVFVVCCTYDLPSISNLDVKPKQPSITIKDINNVVLAKYGDVYGEALTYGQFPQNLIEAVISTEDRKFFDHQGVDIWGVFRAMYYNKKAGRIVQGGSTITQQLAKILFLTPAKNMKRKVQEAIIAVLLEKNFSKEQILAIYLNRVFLGQGIFGVDAASHYYFGKKAENLSLYESAVIAGMLKAPSKYSPVRDSKLSLKRARQVLLNMHDAGYISYKQIRTAKPPIFLVRENSRGALKNPYFTDYVVEILPEMIGNINDDIIVHTTLDINVQNHLEEAVKDVLQDSAKKFKISQAAGISMLKDGAIRAMVGGESYKKSQFNRAVNAYRQPGSAFKLYVYLNALENGLNINGYVEDKPIHFKKWSPKNYSKKFLGTISVKDAFAKSINSVAVRLSEQYGRKNVINMAHKLGVTGNLQNVPSIALGTGELTLQELTASYATVANSGYLTIPYSVLKVIKNDKVIYKRKEISSRRVLNRSVTHDMLTLLEASVSSGTSSHAKISGIKVHGKTGTSQNYRDAWFVGFNHDKVTGIWVGNDDNSSMMRVTGGKIPSIIWSHFMLKELS